MLGESRSTDPSGTTERGGDESGVEKKSWRTGFFRKSHLAKNHQLENGFDEKEDTFSNTCLIFMVWWFMGCFFSHKQLERSATNALTESRRSPSVSGKGYVCCSHVSAREFGECGVFPNTKNILRERVHWKMWFSYQLLYLNDVSRIEVDVFAPLYLLSLDVFPEHCEEFYGSDMVGRSRQTWVVHSCTHHECEMAL